MEESPRSAAERNSTVPPSQPQRPSRPAAPAVPFEEPGSLTPLESAIVRAASSMPPPVANGTSSAGPANTGEETMMDGRVPLELLAAARRSVPPVEPVTAPPPAVMGDRELSSATMVGVPAVHIAANEDAASGTDSPEPVDMNQTIRFGSDVAAVADDERTITAASTSREDDTVMGIPSALLFGLARAPQPPPRPDKSEGDPIVADAIAAAIVTDDATVLGSLVIPESLRQPEAITGPPSAMSRPVVAAEEQTISTSAVDAMRLAVDAASYRARQSSSADDVTVMGATLNDQPRIAQKLSAKDKRRTTGDSERGEDVAALFAKLDASAAALHDDDQAPIVRRNSIHVRQRRQRFQRYVQWAVIGAALVCLGAVLKHIVTRILANDARSTPAETSAPLKK